MIDSLQTAWKSTLLEDRDRDACPVQGRLVLEDGTTFEGTSFGYEGATSGEVVFSTGMVGYPESLTDASFGGQILALTYPLIGNYGVPEPALWESDAIQVAGLIVSQYIDTPSHAQSTMTLGSWLRQQGVPALEFFFSSRRRHTIWTGDWSSDVCSSD